MKSRCSFILKAGLAIVLCFILLVGTMTVGMAQIVDDLSKVAAKINLAFVGSNYRSDYNYVAVNAWDYPAAYSALTKNNDGFVLTQSGQHFYGSVYYKNTNGDSEFYNTKFNMYVGVNESGKSNFYMKPSSSTTFWESNSTGVTTIYENGGGGDMTIQLKKASSKYVKVDFDFYGEYDFGGSNNKFTACKAYQTVVDNISIDYGEENRSQSCAPHTGSVDVTPDEKSGGSGSYDYEYSVTRNGVSVEASYFIANNTFSSHLPGTYVISATATDSIITDTGFASDTTDHTMTITVDDVDYYFASGETGSSWDNRDEYKMKNNGDGSYSLDVLLTEGYQFIFRSSANYPFFANATESLTYTLYADHNLANATPNPYNDCVQFTYNNKHFVWGNSGTGVYTLTFWPQIGRLETSEAVTGHYYLTGYLNDHHIKTATGNLAFNQVGSTAKYTLTCIFYEDHEGSQYPTVTSNTKAAYHPSSNHTGSGTAAGTPDSSPSTDDNFKWQCDIPKNTVVTFTWDMTTPSAPTLSWEQVKAKYVFEYTGRNGKRTYTVESTKNPTAEEYNADGKLDSSTIVTGSKTRQAEINTKLAGINTNLFNTTIEFDSNPSLWDDSSEPYTIKIGESRDPQPTRFTLHVYRYSDLNYNDTTGALDSITISELGSITGDYNQTIDLIINPLSINDTVNKGANVSIAHMKPTGAKATDVFLGWKEYKNDAAVGDFISTHANFGFSLTHDLSIVAVFGTPSGADPTWNAYVDKNEINVEMADSTNGSIYNDNIIRFTYSGDSARQVSVDGISETGVIILAQTSSANTGETKTAFDALYESNVIAKTKLRNYLSALGDNTSAKMNSTKYGEAYAFKIQSDSLSRLNRVDICQVLDYGKFATGQFILAAYYKIGEIYYVSNPVHAGYDSLVAHYMMAAE